jgi:hypothetical protein
MVTKERKVFFLYTIAIAILVVVGFSLLYIYKSKENYFLAVRLYNVIEYSLLGYFFSLYIVNETAKKLLLGSVIFYFIFCVFSFIKLTTPEMPSMTFTVEYILLLCFIIYFFFEVMQESVVEPIYQRAIFWISVAFIINCAGNFFLFIFQKNSYDDEMYQRQYTTIYTTITVIKNLLLCISILIKETPKNSPSTETFDIDLDTLNPINNPN